MLGRPTVMAGRDPVIFRPPGAVVTLVLLLLAGPAAAQSLVTSYTARIGGQDLVNSNGVALVSVAAIIRQDRANVHRFGLRDADDETDPYFADADNRAALEVLVQKGSAPPNALALLRSGDARVRVEVWRGGAGDFVRIEVLTR